MSAQQFIPINPRPMLQGLVDSDVLVRLKWGQTEYKGRLVSVDMYMNVQLAGTEEFVDGKSTGTLGQVLIRCNNVLWISAANAATGGDSSMTG
ncbi:small nuclear ribonucleoprotein SmF [Lophium mytilinum]|uniref:Sm protein F n=1 Tax=Lophium mytilinum TaxID=390894 RepID=A0A6A6QXR9_9PEZI|nr:small nuclear ribonucleoprotein SmF [Lophium mytilinum]